MPNVRSGRNQILKVSDRFFRIQYSDLDIEMFREAYEKNIDAENFDFIKINFYRCTKEVQVLQISLFAALMIQQNSKTPSLFLSRSENRVDEINEIKSNFKNFSLIFNENNVGNEFFATFSPSFEKTQEVIIKMTKILIENYQNRSFFANDMLIDKLDLLRLVNRVILTDKVTSIINTSVVCNFDELVPDKYNLPPITIELINKFFKDHQIINDSFIEISNNLIDWMISPNHEFPMLSNLLSHIYLSRFDLVNTMQFGSPDWFLKLNSWFISYGLKELGFEKILETAEIQKIIIGLDTKRVKKIEGISLYGYFNEVKGLGEAAKSFERLLNRDQKKINTVDVVGIKNQTDSHISIGEVNILSFNGDQYPKFFNNLGLSNGLPNRTIGVWFWELGTTPMSFRTGTRFIDKVWATSKYNYDSFSRDLDIEVDYIPLPILRDFQYQKVQGFIEKPYFLNIFDFLSDFERKNPLSVVQAFKIAFPEELSGPNLIIKSINSDLDKVNAKRLEEEVEKRKDIYWIDMKMNEGELNFLIRNSKALISLHRSEGFGLNIVNAMQMGTPTLVTAYSGNMDFCNHDTSFLVDFDLIPVKTKNVNYTNLNEVWAEPHTEQAAKHMLLLSSERHDVSGVKNAAIKFLHEKYSNEKIIKKVNKSIKKLKINR